MVLNNCTKGVKEMYTARKQQCPNRPPKGLALTTRDGKLTANLGNNVTFLVQLEEVGRALAKTDACLSKAVMSCALIFTLRRMK